jgi:hypothetical protein
VGDSGCIIRFPSRAAGNFQQLSDALCNWCEPEGKGPADFIPPLTEIPGLPKKFSSVLDERVNVWHPSEFFYQPALEMRGRIQGQWANLLLLAGTRGIFVLSDSCRGESSIYGTEITHLPLHRLRSVEWIDSRAGTSGSIRIRLRGGKGELSLAWPVFGGLKAYGLHWTQEADSQIRAANREHAIS